MTIRIAVDESWFGLGGIGRVANEVVARVPDHWTVNAVRRGKKNAGVLTPVSISLELIFRDTDIYWSPGFMPPVISHNFPTVITIHDLTHLHYYSRYHAYYFNYVIRPLLSKVSAIVTVSDFTRNELLQWAGLSSGNIFKIYNGVSSDFNMNVAAQVHAHPYVLYVGNRRSYKNLERLIRAFAMSQMPKNGIRLSISGFPDELTQRLESELNLSEFINYLGFVDEKNLPSVYRGAAAVVFVSLYEGFGLPIIEAMSCGTPVITSNVSSMPEVAGGAAFLVNPFDISEIADAMNKVVLSSAVRNDLISMGANRAKLFNWDNTAAQYWGLFENLIRS